ncbi:hypothetical protein Tco_0062406, partial [Tanacetum coccineum]
GGRPRNGRGGRSGNGRRKIQKWKKRKRKWMWMSMKNGMAQSGCFLIRGDPLNPPPPASASDSESEIEFEEAEAEAEAEVAPIPPSVPANPEPETVTVVTGRLTPLKRLFTNTYVWIGSSSSSTAASHDSKDLTPSHIRSDLDALHRRVRQIENDDVRAENK